MYVVRPQFFLSIIGLLRNMALSALADKKELDMLKKQDLDLLQFEGDLETFKNGFMKNCTNAQNKFDDAIKEIDKAIDHLQKTKDALVGSSNQLRLADKKLEDLSVKKLTKNNAGMKERFNMIHENRA
jgi:hypothetical protein